MTLVQLGSELRMEESLRVHESDKTKGKLPINGQPSVYMVESNKNNNNNRNKGKGVKRKMVTGINQTRNPKNWFVVDTGKMVTLSVTPQKLEKTKTSQTTKYGT